MMAIGIARLDAVAEEGDEALAVSVGDVESVVFLACGGRTEADGNRAVAVGRECCVGTVFVIAKKSAGERAYLNWILGIVCEGDEVRSAGGADSLIAEINDGGIHQKAAGLNFDMNRDEDLLALRTE